MKHIGKILLLVMFVVGVWGGMSFANQAYFSVPVGSEKRIMINAGADGGQIAEILEREGIISNAEGYRWYARLDATVSKAKAGEYSIRPQTSFRDIARMLAIGPERNEAQVTIIEGETIDQLLEQLQADFGISATTTADRVGRSVDRKSFDANLRDEYAFLKNLPRNRSLEGYLFPNTYRVYADQLPIGLIRKQLDEFEKRFAAAKPLTQSVPLKNLDEVIILASIVQDEVRSEMEMKKVAGIFLNRLRDGIALQSDATVNYITGSGRARSTAKDLTIDSPWNTYKYRGLPPSPIGNPGEMAIKAVLDPEPTEYRYFLTDVEGKVYYARTLEGHIENRQKAGYSN